MGCFWDLISWDYLWFFQLGCGIWVDLVWAAAGCLQRLFLGGRSFSCSLQLLQAVGEREAWTREVTRAMWRWFWFLCIWRDQRGYTGSSIRALAEVFVPFTQCPLSLLRIHRTLLWGWIWEGRVMHLVGCRAVFPLRSNEWVVHHRLGQACKVLGINSSRERTEYFYIWAHGIFQFLLMAFLWAAQGAERLNSCVSPQLFFF